MKADPITSELISFIDEGYPETSLPREVGGAIFCEVLLTKLSTRQSELAEEGRPLEDRDKAEVLLAMAGRAPGLFIGAVREVVERDTLQFDDEEVLGEVLCEGVALALARSCGAGWGDRTLQDVLYSGGYDGR